MIRVVIADDHPVVRAGLRLMLTDAPWIAVVGEAATGEEALQRATVDRPDVLLLDITMPGPGVIPLLRRIRQEAPSVPVLVLSMHREDQYAFRVLRAGAAGYLTKDQSSDQLVEAISRVAQGRRYVSATMAERLASRVAKEPGALPHEDLSDREYQVLCLLASGRTVGQVAAQLELSVKTVSTHRTHILEKMGLETNAELVKYAVDNGLVA